MISHKPLKSISHNFAHSFLSLMNYSIDDYVLGHLLKQARLTKLNKLVIDVLHNSAEPSELITAAIKSSINGYNNWFPELVINSGSAMKFVSSATLTIEFDLSQSRTTSHGNTITENPYRCEMTIIDDRGKEYKQVQQGWWYPET